MNSGTELTRPTAVLDSNVIISGLTYPRGNPFNILRLLEEGDIHVYISPFILGEVAQVLRRTFHREEAVVEQAITFLNHYCEVIDPPAEMSLRELNPQDNRVLDCAIQGNVQYLVTGDKGILQLEASQGIRIVRPAEFLALTA